MLLKHFPSVIIELAIVAGLLGLARYRQLTPSLRWLVLLAGFDTVMELVSSILQRVLHISNLLLIPRAK